jgi:protein-S-isoprenylcysteine O-methyltransferase
MKKVAATFVLFSLTIRQLSWTEFLIRFWFFPQLNTKYMLIMGMIMTTTAQSIRSLAMVTCGESFNHMIQRSKKDNHKLITHGM